MMRENGQKQERKGVLMKTDDKSKESFTYNTYIYKNDPLDFTCVQPCFCKLYLPTTPKSVFKIERWGVKLHSC